MTSPYYDTLRRMNTEEQRKKLLKMWKELPESKPDWESYKRKDQLQKRVTFKCWNCDETHPVEVKKDWGFNEVCPACDLHLFDEAEKRDKRRDW